LLEELGRLARDEGIDLFVVGLPRQLDGREGASAARARKLARQIEEVVGVRVVLVDEWFTTKEAAARLASAGSNSREARSRIDSAAASVLLQSYLDGERGRQRSTDGAEREGDPAESEGHER
jgi:putative Holliday junction resolvase